MKIRRREDPLPPPPSKPPMKDPPSDKTWLEVEGTYQRRMTA